VYGTLMSEKVLTFTLGRKPTTQLAHISGFHRYRIKLNHYPGIHPKQGGKVYGLLLSGITDAELQLLDIFEEEGDEYLRHLHQVTCDPSNEQTTAYVYVYNHDLDQLYGEWDYKTHFLPMENEYLGEISSGIIPGENEKA